MGKIREKLKKKIRSRAGESLAETLVALLIAAVALVMLASAMTTASGVITTSQKKLDAYYDAAEYVVNRQEAADSSVTKGSGKVKVKYGTEAGEGNEYSISYYSNGEFTQTPVVTYQYSASN